MNDLLFEIMTIRKLSNLIDDLRSVKHGHKIRLSYMLTMDNEVETVEILKHLVELGHEPQLFTLPKALLLHNQAVINHIVFG